MPIAPPDRRASARRRTNGARASALGAPGDRLRVLGAGDVGQQHGELVAAQAGDGVRGAQRRRAAARRPRCSSTSPWWWPSVSLTSLKRSRSMSITARPPLRPLGGAHALLDAVAEQHAVRQPGERVVERLVLLGDRLAATAVDRQ